MEVQKESCGVDIKCQSNRWKDEIISHKWLILLSILFFVIANILSMFASSYVDKIPTTSATDLILDHIPVLDLDFIFIYGAILTVLIIFIYGIGFRIKDAHMILGQFSLLILIRSFFMIFTHLGKPATALVLDKLPHFYQFFNFNNDLFFSGHTAVPFLAFLIFRKEKIGKFFLVMTFVMAATVLFMHMHYSIDVFAAFFITYGSFKLGEWLFSKIRN